MKNKITKFLTTNLLLKAIGLILAVLLWLILSNMQDPIVSRNVTVTLEYDESYIEENNYIVTSKPTTVTIPVSVRRSNLTKVKSDDFTASVDLSQYLGEGINKAPETTKFYMVITRASSAVYIEDWDYPKTTGRYVDVTVDTIKTNSYTVEFNLTGELPQELQAMEPISNPARVKVTGPTNDFGNLVSVKATVDLSQITGENNSITAQLNMYDGNNNIISNKNLVLSQDTVEVTVETAQKKEVGITVSSMGEPQSGYGCRSFDYNPKTILVTGSEAAIASMQSANIMIPKSEVDITGLTESRVFRIRIEDYLPSGLTLAEGQPEEIEVFCEIEKLEDRTFTINTDIFRFMGTDDRYEYEIISPTTEITLRSFSDVLDDFPETGGNLQGTINVSGQKPNDSTSFATVMISIDRQYSLVNDIKVEIRITEKEDFSEENPPEETSEEETEELTSETYEEEPFSTEEQTEESRQESAAE